MLAPSMRSFASVIFQAGAADAGRASAPLRSPALAAGDSAAGLQQPLQVQAAIGFAPDLQRRLLQRHLADADLPLRQRNVVSSTSSFRQLNPRRRRQPALVRARRRRALGAIASVCTLRLGKRQRQAGLARGHQTDSCPADRGCRCSAQTAAHPPDRRRWSRP